MGKSYVGDIGTRIRIRVCADITTATESVINIVKPDATEEEWACVVEDYENGIIYHDTVSGDFDQAGRYTLQAEITLSNGDHWLAETRTFDVYEAYK